MADDKAEPKVEKPSQIRTFEDLRRKINEVRIRVDKATKPAGPLSIFKVTTST